MFTHYSKLSLTHALAPVLHLSLSLSLSPSLSFSISLSPSLVCRRLPPAPLRSLPPGSISGPRRQSAIVKDVLSRKRKKKKERKRERGKNNGHCRCRRCRRRHSATGSRRAGGKTVADTAARPGHNPLPHAPIQGLPFNYATDSGSLCYHCQIGAPL